jgi:hypothetical protein
MVILACCSSNVRSHAALGLLLSIHDPTPTLALLRWLVTGPNERAFICESTPLPCPYVGGNLISARATDLQGRYEFISIKWP